MKIGNIEKEVAIPEVHSRTNYPWPEMNVGDSVSIEAEKGEKLYNLKRKIGPSARYYGVKTGKEFKTLQGCQEGCHFSVFQSVAG